MGFLDRFGKECVCPLCRGKGAWKTMGKVKCRNANCPNFDLEHSRSAQGATNSLGSVPVDTSRLSGNFDPGESRVEIRYRNAQGEDRIFAGDGSSIRESGEHISLRLVPTGKRAAFAKKWVGNLSDVMDASRQARTPAVPSDRECRVLRFHKRRGTTSPLYESLREKYPNFE
ncbi:MAG TPA: hypothetical protein VL099_11230 [Candidatus Binatia bacterium]|nr:hypothetical protein [Candidatus Binatia bacterium]